MQENMSEEEMYALLLQAYRKSPSLYAQQVLKVKWWKRQVQIALAVQKHSKVAVQASHAVGKSFFAAGLVNWHYDSYDPGITITTAPTQQQVVDILWKEIRLQRGDRGGHNDLKPSAPRMESNPGHFAVGMTARRGDAFQGRHAEHIGIVFDEAVRVAGEFFDAAEGMMTGEDGCWWLCIFNPTDNTSRMYQEVLSGEWYVMDINAMDHPNIHAELHGLPIPYPGAVACQYIDGMVRRYAEEIDPRDRRASDIFWSLPDDMGHRDLDNPRCYRPGSMMETRVLGRWASNSAESIWTDASWKAAVRQDNDLYPPIPESQWIDKPIQIGCDVAWSGNDYTSIVGRRGPAALHWETHNGWRPPQIAQGIKDAIMKLINERNRHFAHLSNYVGEDPKRVLIVLDHDATGNATLDYFAGWNVITKSGHSEPMEEELYPNSRSEVWFVTAEMADRGQLDLSRLPQEALNKLRAQAMGPKYRITGRGREVESKDITRKRLKRSPDDMDALNLAYCTPTAVTMRMPIRVEGGKIVGLGEGMIADAGLRLTDPVKAHRRAPTASPLSEIVKGPLTGEKAERRVRELVESDRRQPSRRLM